MSTACQVGESRLLPHNPVGILDIRTHAEVKVSAPVLRFQCGTLIAVDVKAHDLAVMRHQHWVAPPSLTQLPTVQLAPVAEPRPLHYATNPDHGQHPRDQIDEDQQRLS